LAASGFNATNESGELVLKAPAIPDSLVFRIALDPKSGFVRSSTAFLDKGQPIGSKSLTYSAEGFHYPRLVELKSFGPDGDLTNSSIFTYESFESTAAIDFERTKEGLLQETAKIERASYYLIENDQRTQFTSVGGKWVRADQIMQHAEAAGVDHLNPYPIQPDLRLQTKFSRGEEKGSDGGTREPEVRQDITLTSHEVHSRRNLFGIWAVVCACLACVAAVLFFIGRRQSGR
jgi:hypothetical protein